ncbi:type II RES/Xre toxin-antitoxin system antitoxin [Compostibacter hankyongensis]|uniref:DUF2384 domain-containing protein n=1 Tax=Compostibacter hankyongensis TaxID=1007089 RepID=A0ABP8FY00_9BACT
MGNYSSPRKHSRSSSPSLVEEPAVAYALSSYESIQLSRKGILKEALLQLAAQLSMTLQELAGILHVSEKTLHRYQNDKVLAPDLSERALLLSQLYHKGKAVFGDAANFNDWLRTPLPAFRQQAPITLLDTSFGFQLIMEELGRIEYGIFA